MNSAAYLPLGLAALSTLALGAGIMLGNRYKSKKLKSELKLAVYAGLHHYDELDLTKKGCFGIDDIDRILRQGPSMGIERRGLVLLKKHIRIIGHLVSEKSELVPIPMPYSVVPVIVEQMTDQVFGISKEDLDGVEVH